MARIYARSVHIVAFALVCLAPACALAQDDIDPACVEPLKHAVPTQDFPSPVASAALRGCESEALYYAGGRDVDARHCAYLEREQGNELVFGGSSVLMMIYANGRGVPRDVLLAKRFACESGGAPAELECRLAHLDEMAAADAPETDFDLCDDATSGYLLGFCADRDARFEAIARDARYETLLAGWSAADRNAWQTLERTADGYFAARLEGEVDVSGTARGMLIAGERDALERALYDHLAVFESGELPSGDALALAQADAQLNASYAAARKAATPDASEPDYGPLGTIRPEGIRDAERGWLRYRDAWVEFGTKRWPAVPRDAWLTHFTREREQQLRALIDGG